MGSYCLWLLLRAGVRRSHQPTHPSQGICARALPHGWHMPGTLHEARQSDFPSRSGPWSGEALPGDRSQGSTTGQSNPQPMFNPIIALLHNTKLNRWHPILFQESPLPGPPSPDKPVRHKSVGHHTSGFETKDEAVAEASKMVDQLAPSAIGRVQLALTPQIPWDGEGIPASVIFFVADGSGNLVPAF